MVLSGFKKNRNVIAIPSLACTYSELSQTSEMEHLEKTVIGL